MIRHQVYLRFDSETTPQKITELMQKLQQLQQQLAGAIDFHHRPNISVEIQLVRGFLHMFWIDFIDEQARDAYLVHPDHQLLANELVAALQDGPEDVFVCDILLDS